MIEYLVNNAFGCLIYKNGKAIQYKGTNLSYIKKICLEHLFTFDGYMKAVQKQYGKRYRIPLFVDELHMFIPIKRIRDYDNIWINFTAVAEFKELEQTIEVIFQSQQKLQLNISMKSLRKQINHLEAIHNVKVKHFHF